MCVDRARIAERVYIGVFMARVRNDVCGTGVHMGRGTTAESWCFGIWCIFLQFVVI